jgi:hypothetical protein
MTSVASALARPVAEVTTLAMNHGHRKPHPDVDVATFVLASLDALLAAQAEIRRGLGPGRMTLPAERWHLAAASMAAARRYADDLAVALHATSGDAGRTRTARPRRPARTRRRILLRTR